MLQHEHVTVNDVQKSHLDLLANRIFYVALNNERSRMEYTARGSVDSPRMLSIYTYIYDKLLQGISGSFIYADDVCVMSCSTAQYHTVIQVEEPIDDDMAELSLYLGHIV